MSELRKQILERAYGAQARARTAQEELERQGALLRKSLAGAKQVGRQAEATRHQVGQLREPLLVRLLRCLFCREPPPPPPPPPGKMSKRQREGLNEKEDEGENKDEEEEEDLERIQRCLRRLKQEEAAGTTASWRRTLAPSVEPTVWHQQMDASLGQIQQVAEDLGSMLDEQTRLADLLAIYLDHGADQVIRANEQLLVVAKKA